MPRQARPLATPNPCSNCGRPVPPRRPSLTGEHYCKDPECRKVKNKSTYRRSLEQAQRDHQARTAAADINVARLVHSMLREERIECPTCGLRDAIPGFPHRDQKGAGCGGSGAVPGMSGMTAMLIDAIWPDGSRDYGDHEPAEAPW